MYIFLNENCVKSGIVSFKIFLIALELIIAVNNKLISKKNKNKKTRKEIICIYFYLFCKRLKLNHKLIL